MTFRKRYESLKDKLKIRFVLTSLPNLPSHSPMPHARPGATTQSPKTPVAPRYVPPHTDVLSTLAVTHRPDGILAHASASPNADPDLHLPERTEPHSTSSCIPTENSKLTGLESGQKTIWNGLKKILKILELSADAFGPLGLAIDQMSQCVHIFEVPTLTYYWICFRASSLIIMGRAPQRDAKITTNCG